MEKNKEAKNQSTLGSDTFQSDAETVKALVGFGEKVLENGKISEEITKADQESTSQYLSSLDKNLDAINQEIKESTNTEDKAMLYKQREDVMNRMEEEKENQRHFNENREDKNRNHSRNVFAAVAAVAIGAGSYAAKLLLDNKKIRNSIVEKLIKILLVDASLRQTHFNLCNKTA